MGEGLRKATLDALCSRGPWTLREWSASEQRYLFRRFTADDVRLVYAAIRDDGMEPFAPGDVRCDKIRQLLHKSGLIEYAGKPKRWRVVGSTDV